MSGSENKLPENQSYDVFFSYSRKDVQTAMLIKSAIQSLGYTVFYDQDILEGDSNWRATIARSINNCSGMVFFHTGNSAESKWCSREVNIADEYEKKILPVAFRHEQTSLPESPDIKLALAKLQTTFISDSPSISDLKNQLRPALEKSIGIPANKENSLLLTDFIVAAAENISSRYAPLFEYTAARKITADINNHQISLRWRLNTGNEINDIVIALNKYSRRPQCYWNCSREKRNSCPFYTEKDKVGYSIEAYLEFGEKSRKSKFLELLEHLLKDTCKDETGSLWCGSQQSIKYFFREAIMEKREVNDANDFTATLMLLERAVSFYDRIFGRMEKYLKYLYDIGKIFRNEQMILSCLNHDDELWGHNKDIQSSEKIHFYRNIPAAAGENLKEQLGFLCSIAIKYPEALKIELLAVKSGKISLKFSRFSRSRYAVLVYDFKFSELENLTDDERRIKISGMFHEAVSSILAAETKDNVSTLPDTVHRKLQEFVQKNSSLRWLISQDNGPGTITACGVFRSRGKIDGEMKEFPSVRFSIQLKYHPDKQTIDLSQHIASDFLGAEEKILSQITGFPVFDRNDTGYSEENLSAFFRETGSNLAAVHENVYDIYRKLNDLNNILCRWRTNNAGTVLLLDSTRHSEINAYKDNEMCWEYYLSPGTRLCRRLRKSAYPVMFVIHFESSGAGNASVGWSGDYDFNDLTFREKELFWRYVLSRFPAEWQDRFICRGNTILLKEKFHRAEDLKPLLESWVSKEKGESLMEKMFKEIEKAAETFVMALY